jgi:Fe-S-cluster containining protein
MTVVLDRERDERTLHKYRYEKKMVLLHDGSAFFSPVLKKRKDGTCVYYDREKRRCSIYSRRPHSCKAFFCGRNRKNDRVWQGLLENERHDVGRTLEEADRRAKCDQSNL